MAEERKISKQEQCIKLKNRKELLVSGVINVDSFNEECIVLETELGTLVIRGLSLHINKLNIESSELDVEGEVSSCEYIDMGVRNNKGGIFGSLFR